MTVSGVAVKSSVNTLAYIFGKMIAPSFQKVNVCMNVINYENVPADTNVVRMEKAGYMTAAAHTEATADGLSTNGTITDTYADLTAVAIGVISARSLELKRFGGAKGGQARYLDEQGRAIARYVDNDVLSLASSVTNYVTSTSGLTFDDLYLGQYAIFAAKCPDQNIDLALVAHPRAFQNLKIQANRTGAAAYANDVMLGIFQEQGGKPLPNGYMGQICPGIQGWQTTGQPTASSKNLQLLSHPRWGLMGAFDNQIIVKGVEKISEGGYDELASFYFYDVDLYNDAANVCMKSAV